MYLLFYFILLLHPVSFTALMSGMHFSGESRPRIYAELRPPAGSEADAGDEGEEAERELVALAGARLIAGDIAALILRDGHRLVGRGVAHAVPAEADADVGNLSCEFHNVFVL